MKSLEIVNRNIKAIKKLLYNLKDVKEGTKEDFDKYYHEKELKEQKIIKADLEVLDILRKHLEIIEYLGMKEIETYGLTTLKNKEDFNKLKQWLEENENE